MKDINNGSIRVIAGRQYRLNIDHGAFEPLETSQMRCPTCSRYLSASSSAFEAPECTFCTSNYSGRPPFGPGITVHTASGSYTSPPPPPPPPPQAGYTTVMYTAPPAAKALAAKAPTASDISPEDYTNPFLEFITDNPTVFHVVEAFGTRLKANGFTELSEREDWSKKVKAGGRYFTTRNGSSMMAFVIGKDYEAGNGFAMCAGHIDALTTRLKPVSTKPGRDGYVQLGVAPYAGALNNTWWDRDLGIGGRVIVKNADSGKSTSQLVKLDWPIAKIPTLAPHFGSPSLGPFNKETQMVPIIGLEGAAKKLTNDASKLGSKEGHVLAPNANSFASTQPPRLVELIARRLSIKDASDIVDWELELFDSQPAALIGLDQELLSACRIDDKICSWAALEGLIYAADSVAEGSTVSLAGFFDDEEIGSRLRQGAAGNYMPITVERIVECFGSAGKNTIGRTYANSFLLSADVTHAVNPNFEYVYLDNHKPHLNVGLAIAADSNGHMTTDAVSTSILKSIAEKSDAVLQMFQIRNDSRSGGTVGPMLSSAMGVRAIDAGIAQLSMHSIRATVGSLDPGLGVKIFAGFFEHYEEVDLEFSST
ncbi:hypothetical protein EYR41_003424 [Orbilia oligospora]|uniref:Uncharacterized protein n=1 Tax=Orbilia oligospora TaxID=2813651 RepID=A0A7C8K6R4_ORBOL|nr:hypothetical protein TWF751_010465 [Orbilia oligospora]TGJ71461.1 hypothetical protein EYR41_003424 [Orbilia oligospora]